MDYQLPQKARAKCRHRCKSMMTLGRWKTATIECDPAASLNYHESRRLLSPIVLQSAFGGGTTPTKAGPIETSFTSFELESGLQPIHFPPTLRTSDIVESPDPSEIH